MKSIHPWQNYPDELEPYSEDMEVEEIVNSLNSFIDRTNSKDRTYSPK